MKEVETIYINSNLTSTYSGNRLERGVNYMRAPSPDIGVPVQTETAESMPKVTAKKIISKDNLVDSNDTESKNRAQQNAIRVRLEEQADSSAKLGEVKAKYADLLGSRLGPVPVTEVITPQNGRSALGTEEDTFNTQAEELINTDKVPVEDPVFVAKLNKVKFDAEQKGQSMTDENARKLALVDYLREKNDLNKLHRTEDEGGDEKREAKKGSDLKVKREKYGKIPKGVIERLKKDDWYRRLLDKRDREALITGRVVSPEQVALETAYEYYEQKAQTMIEEEIPEKILKSRLYKKLEGKTRKKASEKGEEIDETVLQKETLTEYLLKKDKKKESLLRKIMMALVIGAIGSVVSTFKEADPSKE